MSQIVRKINSRELHAAVFSDTMEPKFVTKQLIALALDKNPKITLAIVSNLETIMEGLFGKRSITFGILNSENLEEFSNVIDTIATNHPAPILQLKNNKSGDAPAPKVIRTKPTKLFTVTPEALSHFYLKRNDPRKPAWEPKMEVSVENAEVIQPEVPKQWTDFISFDGTSSSASQSQGNDKDRLKSILFSTPSSISASKSVLTSTEEAMDVKEEPMSSTRKSTTTENNSRKLLKGNRDQLSTTFLPMKIHKVQPNPKKVKKKNKRKSKK